MKKIISVLLALVMAFSMSTVAFVAFAEDASEPTEETTTSATDEEGGFKNPFEGMTEEEIMDFIMGLDMHTVKFVFHVAKIGVKIAFVLDKLGFIDLSPIKNAILDAVWNLISGYINPDEPEDTTEPTTGADLPVTELPSGVTVPENVETTAAA